MTKRTSLELKRDRNRNWTRARRITQYLLLGVFLILFLLAGREGGLPGKAASLPFRLDPLAMLAHTLAGRVLVAGSAVALLTVLLTLIFGRAWCGWICPLGTTLDLFHLKKWRGKRPPPPPGWRKVKYILLLATLIAALLGNLSLLVFDPLTLMYRSLAVSLFPALDRIILSVEQLLFRLPFLSEPVATLDAWLRPALLPVSPASFQAALLMAVLFLGVILLNVLAERFWCRYLCPLGGLLGWISKIALFRRVVDDACTGCVLCDRSCPTGTIDPARNYRSDPEECTLCLDCLPACAHSRIAIAPRPPKPAWQPYDPSRREFLTTLGFSAAALALFKTGLLARREPSFLIRPPGMREENADLIAVSRCIRCGACMRTCPTSVIQPAMLEGGVEGFNTPLLVMRLGYCDFSCNACGQVCPSGAIPPLSLEEKRLRVIGKAYIDEQRCIPWADGVSCFVCEEMCPLPEKAITLGGKGNGQGHGSGYGGGQGQGNEEETDGVQVPHVNRELCTGCGICEYCCPVSGESAIRVTIPPTLTS